MEDRDRIQEILDRLDNIEETVRMCHCILLQIKPTVNYPSECLPPPQQPIKITPRTQATEVTRPSEDNMMPMKEWLPRVNKVLDKI
jgi:hypothetical protein